MNAPDGRRAIVAVIVAADSPIGRLAELLADMSSHLPVPHAPQICPVCFAQSWPCARFSDAAHRVHAAGVKVSDLLPSICTPASGRSPRSHRQHRPLVTWIRASTRTATMDKVPDGTLSDAVCAHLNYLDMLVGEADLQSRASLAGTEITRLTFAWRTLLAVHHGRCPQCSGWL
ncbi:MAG: hypothetical protein ACRDTT_30115, partial [Pseudonocardiaceae bacterium]